MFDTTSAVALTTPSCRRREGLLGAVTLLFYPARKFINPSSCETSGSNSDVGFHRIAIG